MNRCPQSEGRRWTSFCSNLKPRPPTFRVQETDRQTSHRFRKRACLLHPSSGGWVPLLVSLPCLKASRWFGDPAYTKTNKHIKKYCEETMGRRSKTMTKCLALWTNFRKNKIQKPKLTGVGGRLDAVRNVTSPPCRTPSALFFFYFLKQTNWTVNVVEDLIIFNCPPCFFLVLF